MSDRENRKRDMDACGCCEGTQVLTPTQVTNRPGLPAVSARVGTYGSFRESMLARLSPATHAALEGLRTREPNDFSIALLDAWAAVADVLTFYQERIANEAYLRTATEMRSLRYLAEGIGYELGRGVAASTALAFTVEDAPGSPTRTTIPERTKAQSVPGPDELPQTFETGEELKARVEWNVLRPRLTRPQQLEANITSALLTEIITDLKAGDGLLFVTKAREDDPSSADASTFHFCRITESKPDRPANQTEISWDTPLKPDVVTGQPPGYPKVFVLRQRAAVFGHNAPDWRPLPASMKANYLGIKDPEDIVFGKDPDSLLSDEDYDETRQWPGYIINAPWYPDRERAPRIIPTPKSVAAAAIHAAKKAVVTARQDALKEAAKGVDHMKTRLETAGAEVYKDVSKVIGEATGDIGDKLKVLSAGLEGLNSIAGDVKQLKDLIAGFLGQPATPGGAPPPPGPLQQFGNALEAGAQAFQAGMEAVAEHLPPAPHL